MPYIKNPKILRAYVQRVCPTDCGELNFAITQLCQDYLTNIKPMRYRHFNEIIGALESAKLEFYRRLVATYEGYKIEENGDVYGETLHQIVQQEGERKVKNAIS